MVLIILVTSINGTSKSEAVNLLQNADLVILKLKKINFINTKDLF